MKGFVSRLARHAAAVLILLATASCGENGGNDPPGDEPTLVPCPTAQTVAGLPTLVTPLGGTVSLGGTSINIPSGALLSPTLITVTLPASKYMEVSITANNLASFVFQQAVDVTIDYSRCSGSGIAGLPPVEVWHINAFTKQPLENMNGVDDRPNRRITFSTGHLSNYAIAF